MSNSRSDCLVYYASDTCAFIEPSLLAVVGDGFRFEE